MQQQNEQAKKTWQEPELISMCVSGGYLSSIIESGIFNSDSRSS